jgi:RHS repeat-associated protein
VLQTYRWVNPTTGVAGLGDAYVLQDANYDVVALTFFYDGTEVPRDAVLAQYAWEPYGTIAAADHNGVAIDNRIGHQGLFYYSFDSADATVAAATPTAHGLYYNRNRWYSPQSGRFTTPDPNATGQLLCSLQYGGSASQEAMSGYDAKDRYADGMNALAYARSNPVHATDPTGLAVNHLVPLYLGGASDGPGIELSPTQHTAFHNYLSQVGFPFGDEGRANWSRLNSTERAFFIREAARTAGVDVDCQGFKRALVDAIASAKQGEVRVASISKAPKLYHVDMIDGSRYNQFLDDITPGGLGAAAKGMAVLNGVMMGVQMMDSLRFSNPHFRELLQATQRSQRTGQLSIMDEVTALDAMYNLTNDPFAGSYGWTAWRDSLW